MQLSSAGKLYNIFEEKLVEISERVGYGGEAVFSEKHRVFEDAWDSYLRELGVSRIMEYPDRCSEYGWHPSFGLNGNEFFEYDADVFVFADPLYTTGKRLEVPKELALKILTLETLP